MYRFGVRTTRESLELSWVSEVTRSAADPFRASKDDLSQSLADCLVNGGSKCFEHFAIVTLSS